MKQYVVKTTGHVGGRGIHVDSFDEVVKTIKTWVDVGFIVTVTKFTPVNEELIPK